MEEMGYWKIRTKEIEHLDTFEKDTGCVIDLMC